MSQPSTGTGFPLFERILNFLRRSLNWDEGVALSNGARQGVGRGRETPVRWVAEKNQEEMRELKSLCTFGRTQSKPRHRLPE